MTAVQTVAEAPVTSGHTVAESLLMSLPKLGVELIFLNPGTDTAPLQEAVARLNDIGVRVPRVVLCPHESVALAAATAYYAVTGRAQVVMVHVDVGTQNLGAMMHNALRSESGVLVIAGRTPVTSNGELPGGRDHVVHWQQDVVDQAGIVRGYARWCGEVHAPETVATQLGRALQVASSTPAGPAYLTVPREILMLPAVETGTDPERPPANVPTRAFPDPDVVGTIVSRLAAARRPLIITSRLGREPAAVGRFEELVDLSGSRVIDRRERLNLRSDHPALLNSETMEREALAVADLVLVIDDPVPWVPVHAAPGADAFVVIVDSDPTHSSMPGWSFDADLLVQADPPSFVAMVCRGLREESRGEFDAAPAPRAKVEQRWSDLREETDDRQDDAGPDVAAVLSPAAVATALDGVLDVEDILVTEATTNAGALRRFVTRTHPGTVFHPGGSGLGWAMGAAIGCRLAAPRRRVMAVMGDGSFLFSNPVAALWTAHAAGAPFLGVILENGGYAASRRPVFDLFPDGAASEANDVVGTRFEDPPDFALLARACGGYGARASSAAELESVLTEAVAAVTQGRCALVCAPVSSPWFEPGGTPA